MYQLTRDDLDASVLSRWFPTLEVDQRTALWHFHVINNALDKWKHKISPWWYESLEDFYSAGVRTFVGRVGRRGGKSSTVCRALVAEALLGSWEIPEGDVGVVAIVSKDRADAAARLRTIEEILKGIGFEKSREAPKTLKHYAMRAQEIEIMVERDGRNVPVMFKVYAASKKGVVGFTAIAVLLDEMTRWVDVETGDNPAVEVLRSIRPSMKTQKSAKLFAISSAWATLDLHYKMIEAGNTKNQRVYCAPSWIANPTLTEADCRNESEDEVEFSREYGNIPMSSEAFSFFDGDLLDRCVGLFTLDDQTERYAGGDFGFTKNASSVTEVRSDGECVEAVQVKARFPMPGIPLKPTETLDYFARHLRASVLMCDSHYQETINEGLEKFEITRVPSPTTTDELHGMYVHVRKLLTCGQLAISPDVEEKDRLLLQLKLIKREATKTGFRIVLPEDKPTAGEHCDVADAFVKAVWCAAVAEGIGIDETLTVKFRELFDERYRPERPNSLTGYTADQWYEKMGDVDKPLRDH